MKIAMLTSVGEKCGIASYTRALVEGLRTLPGVEVAVVPIVEGRQPRAHYVAQAAVLNAPDVDCVHIQHEYSFWGTLLPRQWAYWEIRYLIQKPVVLTAHTTTPLADLLHVKTERRLHRRLVKQFLLRNSAYCDSIEAAPFVTAMTIVHTAAARNELIRRGAEPSYVAIVPSGIPAPVEAPTGGRSFRDQYGLQGRRLITLFGFVTSNKGYEVTLDVLPTLPEDVTLVIAGGHRTQEMLPYLEGLKARIARSGLDARVVITGFLSEVEVAEAMAATDVVVVPHTEATNSYSVTAGLTYGKPIVASDLDTFREVRARADCLDLFRNGDADDFRTKIQALLDSTDRCKVLSANALIYASRFSWPKVAGLTQRVYGDAIAVYSAGHHAPHSPKTVP